MWQVEEKDLREALKAAQRQATAEQLVQRRQVALERDRERRQGAMPMTTLESQAAAGGGDFHRREDLGEGGQDAHLQGSEREEEEDDLAGESNSHFYEEDGEEDVEEEDEEGQSEGNDSAAVEAVAGDVGDSDDSDDDEDDPKMAELRRRMEERARGQPA